MHVAEVGLAGLREIHPRLSDVELVPGVRGDHLPAELVDVIGNDRTERLHLGRVEDARVSASEVRHVGLRLRPRPLEK